MIIFGDEFFDFFHCKIYVFRKINKSPCLQNPNKVQILGKFGFEFDPVLPTFAYLKTDFFLNY
jgi:hypothetical protein